LFLSTNISLLIDMSCGQVSLPPAPEGNLGLTSTTTDLDEGTRGFVKVNEFLF
jgi:hypothetical protein